ncbi:MAG: hypothetical protein MI923_29115 [Phycisphaerales bacterium]|nr:hypothetical protein [Phycisphaerales bacterium]
MLWSDFSRRTVASFSHVRHPAKPRAGGLPGAFPDARSVTGTRDEKDKQTTKWSPELPALSVRPIPVISSFLRVARAPVILAGSFRNEKRLSANTPLAERPGPRKALPGRAAPAAF